MSAPTYHARGDVRGSCGHVHRTIRTALTCVYLDRRACARAGGYSDRRVAPAEGGDLDSTEREALDDAEYDRCQ